MNVPTKNFQQRCDEVSPGLSLVVRREQVVCFVAAKALHELGDTREGHSPGGIIAHATESSFVEFALRRRASRRSRILAHMSRSMMHSTCDSPISPLRIK